MRKYKIILKSIALLIFSVILYVAESIIFLLIYGGGGQAGVLADKVSTKIVMYALPLVIVGTIAYRMFKKK